MFFCKKKHFLKLGGALLIAFVALAFATVIFFLLLPHLMSVTMAFLFLVLFFILIWIIIYIAMILGAALYRYTLPLMAKEEKKAKH
jgi:uncharacterized membrane protein